MVGKRNPPLHWVEGLIAILLWGIVLWSIHHWLLPWMVG
jgi:hypothetical protein